MSLFVDFSPRFQAATATALLCSLSLFYLVFYLVFCLFKFLGLLRYTRLERVGRINKREENVLLVSFSRFNAELESPGLESAPLLPVESSQPALVRFINSESGEYSVDLPTFLIQRACANSALVNYFYWLVFLSFYHHQFSYLK